MILDRAASLDPGRTLDIVCFYGRPWAATAGEADGLSDGLAPLDGLGVEAYSFFDVEDRVDLVLHERGEFEDGQDAGGWVVGFGDREAPLPIRPQDELVNCDVRLGGPLVVHLKDPGGARFVLGR